MTAPDFDEGLDHGHQWATEPVRPASPLIAGTEAHLDEHYDEGLDHGHVWAMQDSSR